MARAKQVTVDEAVVAAGGKPGGLRADYEAAAGITAAAEKAAEAAVHFDRRAVQVGRTLIPLAHLRPMKANPRGELGDVSALVASIEANGFIGALSVRSLGHVPPGVEHFEVWAGNRRLSAAEKAGLVDVPCDVYDLTEVQALELNLTEQINRSDLTPLEEGQACRALQELSGYTVDQVAAKLGQSRAWVRGRVALCGLAPEVRTALAKGEVSLTVAAALAALPSQKMQVDGLELYEVRAGHTSNQEKLEAIRRRLCRPLRDATWKLTALLGELPVNAEGPMESALVACSECPHNSANDTMPGLFDVSEKAPTCAKVDCFEQKLRITWEKKTEKARAAGAKVLGLEEGRKLFPYGDNLTYASRYVEADAVVQEDRSKRSWAQLVEELPEEVRPALHIAQDGKGKPHELLVKDKVVAAVAKHLKLKWAIKTEEEQVESAEARDPAKKAEAENLAAIRELVRDEVIAAVALKLSEKFSLMAARLIAQRAKHDVDQYAKQVLKRPLPKDWLEEGAKLDELLAFTWWTDARDEYSPWSGFPDEFKALAKQHGFDLEKMVKANLAAAPAEEPKVKRGKK